MFRLKDKLENAVHDWVCGGKISLRAARRAIAADWRLLCLRVFGVAPTR